MSLFVDADVLDRLAGDDPFWSLHDGNLADFSLALEGVSHFLYVAWSAQASQNVSQAELELQAEVDKFVLAVDLLGQQRYRQSVSALHHRLFDRPRFEPTLSPAMRARYQEAHDGAAKYCARLRRGALQSAGALTEELRSFYRLRRQEKLNHASRE